MESTMEKNQLDTANRMVDSALFDLKQRTFHIIRMIGLQYVLQTS